MKLNKFLILIIILIIQGCAPNLVWMKPNGTQQEFSKTKYDCLQKSQQPYSSYSASNVGGIVSSSSTSSSSASSGLITNDQLYSACMNSNGWYLQQEVTQNSQSQQNQTNQQNVVNTSKRISIEEAENICNRYHQNKTSFNYFTCVGFITKLGLPTVKWYTRNLCRVVNQTTSSPFTKLSAQGLLKERNRTCDGVNLETPIDDESIIRPNDKWSTFNLCFEVKLKSSLTTSITIIILVLSLIFKLNS